MAFETTQNHWPGAIAGSDMSGAQYYAVEPSGANGEFNVGNSVPAILQNSPLEGEAATVAVSGITKFAVGAAGIECPNFVAIDATGRAIEAEPGDMVIGQCYQVGIFTEGSLITINIEVFRIPSA